MDGDDINEEKQIDTDSGNTGTKFETTTSDDPVEIDDNGKAATSGPSHKTNPDRDGSHTSPGPQKSTRSRSRSPSRSQSRARSRSHLSKSSTNDIKRASPNPFVNFLYVFRKNCAGMKSKDIFRLAGERWRQMTSKDKQPYVDAANRAKQQRYHKRGKSQMSIPGTSKEPQKSHPKPGGSRSIRKVLKKTRNNAKADSDTDTSSDASETGTSEGTMD